MVTLRSWPRPLLHVLAAVFAVMTTLYSGIWIYSARQEPTAYLGIEYSYSEETASLRVVKVLKESPAERAGLVPEDRIVTLDGSPVEAVGPLYRAVGRGRAGDRVRLAVERPGTPRLLFLDVTLDPGLTRSEVPTQTRWLANEILGLYPVLFLAVALAVLFLRLEDRNAWLLALFFGSLIAGAPLLPFEPSIPTTLRGFALAYKVAFNGMAAALFLYFFSVFPTSSPLDSRLPWLKRLWLIATLVATLPLALWVFAAGSSRPLALLAEGLGHIRYWLLAGYFFGGSALGLISLAGNAVGGTVDARRKSRVIVVGTFLGFVPTLLLQAVALVTRRSLLELPFWLWAPCVFALLLMPLSFAYAVVKHRVLEIPVLLRRSARYLLVQRGSIGLLLMAGGTFTGLFVLSLARYLAPRTEAAVAAAITLGAVFGTALVWAGTKVHQRVRERIDRAFFRGTYDAQLILEDLAVKARAASSRDDLAALLEKHLQSALLPRSLALYLESGHGLLRRARPDTPGGLRALPDGLPLLAELARGGRPCDVTPLEHNRERLGALASVDADCLVPILARDGHLAGLLVLGPRLSEEPYSNEDKRLLASVAGQAGVALESMRLAEQMAERLEVERRAAHELELAREVQTRLLAQEAPAVATLDYAGRCVQARVVGGDYYDFLDLGPGRVGLVLADVCGKGFSAALLMANLQASLRSRSADDMRDLPRQLHSVNQLLYRCSDANRFVTLFVGIYDQATRRVRYANCGHNPPLILRADDSVARLGATGLVLGVLEKWECGTDEAAIGDGDILAIYTDGVTEAFRGDGVEFGEQRLLATLRAHRDEPIDALLDTVVATVHEFSGGEQHDDLTLVLARGRSSVNAA